MKPSFRAAPALLVVLAAAAPARAAAQEAEAWVLPRGLLELSGTGVFLSHDARLGFGDPALGAELVEPMALAVERATRGSVLGVRAGLADFFNQTTDPEPGAVPDSLTTGDLRLRARSDTRSVPLALRYGLTSRLTVSVIVPFERGGTSLVGPYLRGTTLGINPNRPGNGALLAGIDTRFGDLGSGLLLPVRGTPEAMELQSRLRAIDPADTLTLPVAPLTLGTLLAAEGLAGQLTAEEAAALGIDSARRQYQLGDVQLGARFQLLRGPSGWPFPDSVTGRSLRTAVGARLRLPTGRGDASYLFEVPPGNGHMGVGVDVLNDVFFSRRWYVNASASVDVLFPADVQRLAFSATRPFPADTALRTVRREPGPRLAATIAPRWRLTDEISFSGEYSLLAQQRTRYTGGEEGLLPTPLEWRTGGSLHSLALGARYSSLQAYARGRANVPFEVSVSLSRAIAGGGAAPEAAAVRITGRIFVDPRGFARLLPGDPPAADTLAQPTAPPADATPSQVRPVEPPAGRVVVPPTPDTVAADSTPPRVPAPPAPQASASSSASSSASLPAIGAVRIDALPSRRSTIPASSENE